MSRFRTCFRCLHVFPKGQEVAVYVKAMLKYVEKCGCPNCGGRVFLNTEGVKP